MLAIEASPRWIRACCLPPGSQDHSRATFLASPHRRRTNRSSSPTATATRGMCSPRRRGGSEPARANTTPGGGGGAAYAKSEGPDGQSDVPLVAKVLSTVAGEAPARSALERLREEARPKDGRGGQRDDRRETPCPGRLPDARGVGVGLPGPSEASPIRTAVRHAWLTELVPQSMSSLVASAGAGTSTPRLTIGHGSAVGHCQAGLADDKCRLSVSDLPDDVEAEQAGRHRRRQGRSMRSRPRRW